MKTKWVVCDVVATLTAIVLALGLYFLKIWGAVNFLNRLGVTLWAVIYSVICIIVLTIACMRTRIMKFDENGFTVYGLLGKIGFCSWESIEKAEYFYPRQVHSQRLDREERARNGRIILVYNNEHYMTPELNENGRVYNKDRKGRRLRLNGKNYLAWAMINYFTYKTFKQFFAHYRPDLFIEYNDSIIYRP